MEQSIDDKQARMNKPKDKQTHGLNDFRMNMVRLHRLCVSWCQKDAKAVTDIFKRNQSTESTDVGRSRRLFFRIMTPHSIPKPWSLIRMAQW